MTISVSSLGFTGHPIYNMAKLPSDIGIEIFYEWGSEQYWRLALKRIMAERTGPFSIHAPYLGDIVEMSLTDKEDEMYDYLMQPFDMLHEFGGRDYVVHINGPYLTKPTPEEKAERLKHVEERLAKFEDICEREDVNLLVENLAYSRGIYTLCDQEDFLSLFAHNERLKCLIDTGHAVLGGIDVCAVQKALGPRLMGYHMHDNDGLRDAHARICTGVIDWARFSEGAKRYTPNASFVMEYNPIPDIKGYAEDAEKIRDMLG